MSDTKSNLDGIVQEATNRFGTVLSSLNEAVLIADREGTVKFINPRFSDFTGYTLAEAVGQRVYDLLYPPGSEDHTKAKTAMLARYEERLRGKLENYELHIYHKDGTRRWMEVKAGPLVDTDGEILGSIGALFDITERKELEHQLRWSQKMEAVGRLARGCCA